MIKKLLLLLAISSTCSAMPYPQILQEQDFIQKANNFMSPFLAAMREQYEVAKEKETLERVKTMLQQQAPELNTAVINKVLTTLKCASEYNVAHNNILTIIDYSLPSSEKRLWVFDLQDQKLLFHTYVSHGIKSGSLVTNFFSNKYNSRATSIGVYTTEKAYYGREGLSLRLAGLDRGFNDNASGRSIVMHGGWYVDENFIKKYGRPGRSWGCPALPLNLSSSIINTIKDKSFFVAYYPSDSWFAKSKFLRCDAPTPTPLIGQNINETNPPVAADDIREAILFVDGNKNNKHEDYEAVAVMPADDYEKLFHTKAPLRRMLRRQIDHMEYIALSSDELKTEVFSNEQPLNNQARFNELYFAIPVIKMSHGYYETEMHLLPLGKVTSIEHNGQTEGYTVHFQAKTINIKPTNQFIRWVGL